MYNNLKNQVICVRNNVLLYIAGLFFYLNDTKFTLPLEEVMVND